MSTGFLKAHNLKINDSIFIDVGNDKINFKIISDINEDDYRTIYVKQKWISKIANILEYSSSEYILKIKNMNDIISIKNQFKKINLKTTLVDSSGQEELEMYYSFGNSLKIIGTFIIIFILAIFYCITRDMYFSERKNIVIKKLVGYTNMKCIRDILLQSILYIFFSSIIISFIISVIKFLLVVKQVDFLVLKTMNYRAIISCYRFVYTVTSMIFLLSFY